MLRDCTTNAAQGRGGTAGLAPLLNPFNIHITGFIHPVPCFTSAVCCLLFYCLPARFLQDQLQSLGESLGSTTSNASPLVMIHRNPSFLPLTVGRCPREADDEEQSVEERNKLNGKTVLKDTKR